MGRKRGDGSIYTDKHGQVWVKFPLGHDRYRRKRCDSASEAEAVLKVWRRAAEDGQQVGQSHQPLQRWLERWLADRQGAVKETTWRFYQRHAGYAAAYLGQVPLEDLTPADVDRMVETMKREKVKPQTIRHTKIVLSMALKRAVKSRLILFNAASEADKITVEPYPAYELTPIEAARLIDVCGDHRLALAVHLALFLGMRRGEILALRWGDIDREQGVLTIQQGKTAQARRRLPLTPALLDRIAAHWSNQIEERQVCAAWKEHTLIVPSEVGTPLTGRNFTRWFKLQLAKAGLPMRIRFHDLRHYAMSEWYAAGADPKTVQALAGHADPALSQKIYAHARPDVLRAAVERAERRMA